jgi:hypothetical protein
MIEPRRRIMVLREWLLAYFTRERSALLITGAEVYDDDLQVRK